MVQVLENASKIVMHERSPLVCSRARYISVYRLTVDLYLERWVYVYPGVVLVRHTAQVVYIN